MSASEASKFEQFKETVRQDWTGAAAAWRKWNPQFVVMTRAATQLMMEAAQLKRGMRVLDLASGSGEPALTLAEVVGRAGHVTATDLVPAMLAIAEDNARERGLPNMSFEPADAESLPFAGQSFDAITCRFGVMFFPNVGQALGEIRRVLKPGGRATFLAWGPLDQNPYLSDSIGPFIKRVQPPPPDPDAPNVFRFAETGKLSVTLREAGFRDVQEEYRTIPWPFPGKPEEAWDAIREIRAPAYGRLMDALSREQLEEAIGEVLRAIREHYDGQQVNYEAVVVLASGAR